MIKGDYEITFWKDQKELAWEELPEYWRSKFNWNWFLNYKTKKENAPLITGDSLYAALRLPL